MLDKAAGRIYRNTGESPEHSIHMVEDCFTTDEWVALSGPLPGMAGLEKAPLLNPLSGLTVPWPAQSGNAAFRFRYAESGPIPGWMGAEISPKGAACAGPTTVGPRRSWTLLSRPAPELAAFGTKVQFVTDVNGDGLPDALVRMDTHSDTRLRAHLSKYKMGGPYPAVPFMSPAAASQDLSYFLYPEHVPAVASRGFFDMDGDGISDAVSTDRFLPRTTDTYYGYYDSEGQSIRAFIDHTRISYLPGHGHGFDCNATLDARCKLSDPVPNNYFTSPTPEYPLDFRPVPGTVVIGAPPENEQGWFGGARVFPDKRIQLGVVKIRDIADISPPPPQGREPDYNAEDDPIRHVAYADVNGDGFTDVVVVRAPPYEPVFAFSVYLNEGGVRLRRYCPQDPTGGSCDDATDPRLGRLAVPQPLGFRVIAADMNGSGRDDIVIVEPSRISAIGFMDRERAGRLVRIDNGRGAHTSFDYESYSLHSSRLARQVGEPSVPDAERMPVNLEVVRSIQTDNGLVGDASIRSTTTFRYRKPAYDRVRKAFKGFGEVTTLHDAGDATRDEYAFGPCDTGRSGCTRWSDDDPLSAFGPTLRASTIFGRDPDESPSLPKPVLRQTVNLYEDRQFSTVEPRQAWSRSLRRVTTRLIDGTASQSTQSLPVSTLPSGDEPRDVAPVTVWSSAGQKLVVVENLRDGLGNVIEHRDYGEVLTDAPLTRKDEVLVRKFTFVEVAPSVWRPTTTTTYGSPGAPVRRARMEYDAAGNPTRAFAELGAVPALQRVHQFGAAVAPQPPSSSPGWVLLRTTGYDPMGNVITTSGPVVATTKGTVAVESSRYEYDSVFGSVRTVEIVDLDGPGSGPGRRLEDRFVVDRGLGVLLQHTDPHGNRSRREYDGFGRMVAVFDPTPTMPVLIEGAPRVTFAYEDRVGLSRSRSWIRTEHPTADPRGLESIDFIDGFGVVHLSVHEGETMGTWVASGASIRNSRGQVVQEASEPYEYWGSLDDPDLRILSTTVPMARTYDAYGRLTTVWEGPPSGVNVGTRQVLAAQYAPLFSAIADAKAIAGENGSPDVRTHYDGHGRARSIQKTTATDSAILETDYLPTGEAYRERRRSRFSASQVVRERTFDTLGRVVSQTEPNTTTNGRAMIYAYNDAGWLVGTSDSRGCGENLGYDPAGRLVYRDQSPCTGAQVGYTPPALGGPNVGNGTESYYVYDAPEPGESADQYGAASALLGRLVAKYDLGSHDRTAYDALGRTTRVSRRIVAPGVPSSALGSRYTTHWFTKDVAYDDDDQVTSESTGADAPELLLGPGESRISYQYGRLGHVASIGSTYGEVMHSVALRADGREASVTYGDTARTSIVKEYYEQRINRPVFQTTVSRAAPDRWSHLDYTPADPLEPTQPTIMSQTLRFYDSNGNPTAILEGAEASPNTARNQYMTYDDLDRLTKVDYGYSGNDAATSPFAHEGPASRHVPKRNLARRTQSQTFAFDYLGNIRQTASDDPSGGFDRHLGVESHGSSTDGPNQLRSADGVEAKYDSAGNLVDLVVDRQGACEPGRTCKQRFIYTWDPVGQLAKAERWDVPDGGSPGAPSVVLSPPTWSVEYAYGDDGGRVLKSATGDGDTSHTIDVFDSLRLVHTKLDGADYERDASKQKLKIAGVGAVEILEADVPDGQKGEARLFLRIPDGMGSSSFVIDQRTSEVVEHTTYDVYGTVDTDYRPERWAGYRDSHKFTDKEEDVEVGLVYFGARYYHPNLRRWISPDPLTIEEWDAESNPYTYVDGQVTTHTDPTGLFLEAVIGAIVSGISGDGNGSSGAYGAGYDDSHRGESSAEVGAGGSGGWRRVAGHAGGGRIEPPVWKERVRGAIGSAAATARTGIAAAGHAAVEAQGWVNRYHRAAIANALLSGTARRGESVLADPTGRIEQLSGVKSDSSAGMAGAAAAFAAEVVLENPQAVVNTGRSLLGAASRIVRREGQAVAGRGVRRWGRAVATRVVGSFSRVGLVGGRGPVRQGAAGVQRAILDLEAAGGRVLGKEITIEAGGVITRPDLYVELPSGQKVFLEVKTGATAALTPNQKAAFPHIWTQGGIPHGANAVDARLTPGVPIGATPVWTVHYPWPLP